LSAGTVKNDVGHLFVGRGIRLHQKSAVGEVSVIGAGMEDQKHREGHQIHLAQDQDQEKRTILLSVALTPIVMYALWRGVGTRPAWLPIVLVTTGIAWIAVSRFNQFVFIAFSPPVCPAPKLNDTSK
jgi:hypothetical protein